MAISAGPGKEKDADGKPKLQVEPSTPRAKPGTPKVSKTGQRAWDWGLPIISFLRQRESFNILRLPHFGPMKKFELFSLVVGKQRKLMLIFFVWIS